MNRRGFLGTMLALGAAPAVVRAESLMAVRSLWVPDCKVVTVGGNSILTIEQITRDALRILNAQMSLMTGDIYRTFGKQADALVIRRPEPYRL